VRHHAVLHAAAAAGMGPKERGALLVAALGLLLNIRVTHTAMLASGLVPSDWASRLRHATLASCLSALLWSLGVGAAR
jgi:hypothetical protein